MASFKRQPRGTTDRHPLAHEDLPELMKREKLRLLTYHNWPFCNLVDPQHLAKSGLYYIGPQERVKCAFCNEVIYHWKKCPSDEHETYFPNCAFVMDKTRQGRGVGNIPVEDDRDKMDPAMTHLSRSPTPLARELGIMVDKPRHSEYVLEIQRLETYRNFPPDCPVKPEILAKAGFFYTGIGDTVRCFYCDMGLHSLERGDDPWEEHARHYPNCSNLESAKGREYIELVQRRSSPDQTRSDTEQDITSAVQDISISNGTAKRLGETVDMQRSLMEENRLSERQCKRCENNDTACIKSESHCPECGEDSKGTIKTEPVDRLQSLREENHMLKEQKLCKHCKKKDADTVFLPCGHLCYCDACVRTLYACAMCDKEIIGLVKVFLA